MTEQQHGDGAETTRGRRSDGSPAPRPRWVTAFLVVAGAVVVVALVLHVTGLVGGMAMHR